ncbi:MAG: beta-ketoacyl-ACP synthase [Rhodospirillaceae bacterium]|nr:beta-ketoacyl-ACP synthase [Rhodospirillaceae bacterium]
MTVDGTRAVAVTGMGIVTSLGLGVAENWTRLSAGRSGIHTITRFPTAGLRTTICGSVDFMDVEPPGMQALTHAMARAACREALAGSGLGAPGRFPGPLFLAAPPIEHEWPERLRLARRAGAANGRRSYGDLLRAAAQDPGDLHRLALNGSIADLLADELGTDGSPITVTTACASGASAIQLGVEAIRRGACKAALAVGADGSISVEALVRFSLLSTLSTANEVPEKAAKPFARNRDGFVMGEGAAALVLEEAQSARRRGAEILAYVLGCGEAADTFHRTRSNPNGWAIVASMQRAIDDAGLSPDDIDYVNAHGTGTPENDKMECLGMHQVFGARAPRVPISSNKSMIGHTLTAAGTVEAAFSILALRHGLLPPTINYEFPDPALPLDVVPNVAREARVRRVLSNSFGFGGQNVSLVFGAA